MKKIILLFCLFTQSIFSMQGGDVRPPGFISPKNTQPKESFFDIVELVIKGPYVLFSAFLYDLMKGNFFKENDNSSGSDF